MLAIKFGRYHFFNLYLLSFGLGIWIGSTAAPRPILPPIAPAVAWIVVLVIWLRVWPKSDSLLLPAALIYLPLSLALGFLLTTTYTGHNQIQYTGPSHPFKARIVEPPDPRPDQQLLVLTPLESIGQDSAGRPSTGRILAKLPRFPEYHLGETVLVSGKIEPPPTMDGFNYPLYLLKSGISAVMTKPSLTVTDSSPPFSFNLWFFKLRQQLERQANNHLPEPEASFLNGILLGSKRAIPSEVQQELKTTGTTHIIAISGANITIMLDLLSSFLPLYSLLSSLQATVLAAGFVTILTGGSASVVRGALVAILGRYLRYKGRKLHPTAIILFSAALMLIFNPLYLRADPGFQLSFAAYAGLLYFSHPLTKLLDRTPLKSLPDMMRSALIETTAATLGTAPISWLQFGAVSPLGLIVNPLILWLLPLTTFLGFILIAWGISPISIPVISQIISLPLWLLLHTILGVVKLFAHL